MKHLALALAVLSACMQACAPGNERSERTRLMIAQTKLASDPHSWSRPNEARVTRLHWDASVDMKAHTIRAVATYGVVNVNGANEIVFDTRDLNIEEVRVNGEIQPFTLGDARPFIGAPLRIAIPADSCEVAVRYATSPDAAALLWVDGDKPFLFSQSQAILARTWLPCQDSPGVRIPYTARVQVPAGLLALMSAENPRDKSPDGVYTFRMDQPVPSYLMALAVGDVAFREIGPRTGVYAVPDLADDAAAEFSDLEAMVAAAEQLYGPYAWGRYDLLVLPAAFPFGGMENPRLTFATPTILAGDKSLVSLVAHELAHSWSGNLVTNSTWNDFWLNEGFTVYFEMRIMEAVYGKDQSEMLALLARQDLDATLLELPGDDTHLKLDLNGRDPDDGMTDIAYNKGYFFLRMVEEKVGRQRFDTFLKAYFTEHAFQVMDTEQFLTYLRARLLTEAEYTALRVDEWVYAPGLPDNAPLVGSQRMQRVDFLATGWLQKHNNTEIPWSTWSYQERYRFLSLISSASAADLATLDKSFAITATTNSEVLFKWLELSILAHYGPAYARAEEFLCEVGRRKFVLPLYEAMVNSGQLEMAKRIYSRARPGYHAVTALSVDELLTEAEQ